MQVIRHRFGIMSALLCSIVLAGCSDREVILPGKREPILTSEPSVTDGAGALAAPKAFAMPTQKKQCGLAARPRKPIYAGCSCGLIRGTKAALGA